MNLRTCEFIGAAVVTLAWVLFFGPGLPLPQLVPGSILALTGLTGVGLVALWCALLIKDFACVPWLARLLVAAGLCIGVVLALFYAASYARAQAWSTAAFIGLVLVPGCRHLSRVLPSLRNQRPAKAGDAAVTFGGPSDG